MTATAKKRLRYGDDKERDEWVGTFIRNNVLGCQSSLVTDLLGAGLSIGTDLGKAFGIDEIEGLYPDPSDWSAEQCREYIEDEISSSEAFEDDDEHERLEAMREYIQQNAEAAEVFEWWLVADKWVADKLRQVGEVILDNGYGIWWGRTCTGQSISLDPTFYEIAESMLDT